MSTEKRLIDANALLKVLKHRVKGNEDSGIVLGTNSTLGIMEEWVRTIPTVDAVEVVHGHWRYYSTTMQECSNCQRHTARHKFKYCPHCGAIMEDKYHESTD